MSKADRQTLTLLSVCAACFYQIHKGGYFARVDINERCMNNYILISDVVFTWNAEESNFRKALPVISQWSSAMNEDPYKLNPKSLMYMVGRITDDLLGKIKNQEKRAKIMGIVALEKDILDFVDRDGLHFDDYEHADQLLDMLYKLIEWE